MYILVKHFSAKARREDKTKYAHTSTSADVGSLARTQQSGIHDVRADCGTDSYREVIDDKAVTVDKQTGNATV
jgi:hypothetical protein